MAVQLSYPGVYIEEFTPGAPIEGVGTNTAAFIGPAARGEINQPTKITSWDQFRATYGEQPLPGFFMWYAVRGFFENGGQVCYVVRASNGAYAGLGLDHPPASAINNRAGAPLLSVRARRPGVPEPRMRAQTTVAHLLAAGTTSLYRPTARYTVISVQNLTLENATQAAQFRPGDWVAVGPAGVRAQVMRVGDNTLRVDRDLTGLLPPNGDVRLADVVLGETRVVRIQSTIPVPADALVPGTLLTISQDGRSDSQIVESVQTEMSGDTTTYRVTFRQPLAVSISLAAAATVQSEEFDFRLIQGSTTPYANLAMDPAHPRYFARMVNDTPGPVRLNLIEPPPPGTLAQNLPEDIPDLGRRELTGGRSERLSEMASRDAAGDAPFITALDTLRAIDDVNLIAIPDRTTAAVQRAVITHCEQMGDRFAVLDGQLGLDLFGSGGIEGQRRALDSTRGFAALYYPWLRVSPVVAGEPILVPPSGHVCGIIARSDATRGVHKAPANEIVNGALGLERIMSDVDQGELNRLGINVIRIFQTGGRPMLWGARTTATDRNWQYVNIRRLFLFLEESIQESIRWAVFEPNTPGLWAKLRRTITEFLTRVWRDGALFGTTPAESFYVRIDDVLNPFSEQALGRLHIEIGVRPSYPAEFIIVRIGIWPGGSEVVEA